MRLLLDSFWRAAAYCLHPRVIVLSMLPLVLMAGAALGIGYLFWEPALDAVRATFESWAVLAALIGWLESIGLSNLKTVLAPLVVVFLSTPVIVVLSLLLVAAFMTPAMLKLVAARRFPLLERKHGGSFFGSAFGALWATVAALCALLVSIPLWFVPPLVLILPPLIWGWLTYRVLAFDVLAAHASVTERRFILRARRWPLLAMGVVCGFLGALPSLLWAASAATLIFAPLLAVVSVWLYTLVFAFASAWFAHFALAELQRLRTAEAAAASVVDAPPPPPPLLPPALTSDMHA